MYSYIFLIIDRYFIIKIVYKSEYISELLVRKMLHRKGIRFRLHAKDLPGKPDISNKSKGSAIVHSRE